MNASNITETPENIMNNNQSMAQAAMARAGFHQSPDRGTRHWTIEHDNSLPGKTKGNEAGHINGDGSAKAKDGASILWALPRQKS